MIGLGATPIIDLRGKLPTGSRRPSQRGMYDIHGVVAHHTASDLGPDAVAHYHTRNRGWPTIGYHFWVDPDGTVYQLNDVNVITNSQGGRGSRSPISWTTPNKNFLAVVFRGDLTQTPPTPESIVAFRWLWAALQGALEIAPDMMLSHQDFKPTLCPGLLVKIVEEIRGAVESVRDLIPSSVEEAQGDLVALGYDLGSFGPAGDGVDGLWGQRSQAALEDFAGSRELSFTSAYAIAEGLSELT